MENLDINPLFEFREQNITNFKPNCEIPVKKQLKPTTNNIKNNNPKKALPKKL